MRATETRKDSAFRTVSFSEMDSFSMWGLRILTALPVAKVRQVDVERQVGHQAQEKRLGAQKPF